MALGIAVILCQIILQRLLRADIVYKDLAPAGLRIVKGLIALYRGVGCKEDSRLIFLCIITGLVYLFVADIADAKGLLTALAFIICAVSENAVVESS